ncbi:MAG: hypothetical protein ACM3Q1_00225 [Bacteroidales bacterium]
MRTLMVVVAGLMLAGCVEVTRFKSDGGDLYYVDCDNPVRLQSCRAALESVCPNGYDLAQAATRVEDGRVVSSKSGYFRCR